MNRSRLVDRLTRRIAGGLKAGRKQVGGMSHEQAKETAEELLRGAGWRLAGVEYWGRRCVVTSQEAGVMGDGHRMDVSISFDLDQRGNPRNIEIEGYLEDGSELRPRRVSRLVSPRDAGRQLSP